MTSVINQWQVIAAVSDLLTSGRVNVTWSSRQFRDECSLQERWFGTPHSCKGTYIRSGTLWGVGFDIIHGLPSCMYVDIPEEWKENWMCKLLYSIIIAVQWRHHILGVP